MNNTCIVVGGSAYADIDVLACIAAYTPLLNIKGYQAQGIITGPWNQTISHSIRQWSTGIAHQFLSLGEPCSFILVDISDPKFDCKFTPRPNDEWLINIASIEEGRSYFYTNSDRFRNKIIQITDAKEINRTLQVSHRLWLRKEILREFFFTR